MCVWGGVSHIFFDGCLYFATVNNATMNMVAHLPLQHADISSFGCKPRKYDFQVIWRSSFNFFWANSILFSIMASPIYISSSSVQVFPFLHTLANAWNYSFSYKNYLLVESSTCSIALSIQFSKGFIDRTELCPLDLLLKANNFLPANSPLPTDL